MLGGAYFPIMAFLRSVSIIRKTRVRSDWSIIGLCSLMFHRALFTLTCQVFVFHPWLLGKVHVCEVESNDVSLPPTPESVRVDGHLLFLLISNFYFDGGSAITERAIGFICYTKHRYYNIYWELIFLIVSFFLHYLNLIAVCNVPVMSKPLFFHFHG